MTKQISEHAAAAKIIRKELKANNVKAKVRAASASMTSSVTITLEDAAPWTVKAVEDFVAKFEYGHFDGMQDMYIPDNNNDDLPQVKFVFVYTKFSEEKERKAWDMITEYLGLEKTSLEDKPDTVNHGALTLWTDNLILQCLNNKSRDVRLPEFWTKPVKVIPAVTV